MTHVWNLRGWCFPLTPSYSKFAKLCSFASGPKGSICKKSRFLCLKKTKWNKSYKKGPLKEETVSLFCYYYYLVSCLCPMFCKSQILKQLWEKRTIWTAEQSRHQRRIFKSETVPSVFNKVCCGSLPPVTAWPLHDDLIRPHFLGQREPSTPTIQHSSGTFQGRLTTRL